MLNLSALHSRRASSREACRQLHQDVAVQADHPGQRSARLPQQQEVLVGCVLLSLVPGPLDLVAERN